MVWNASLRGPRPRKTEPLPTRRGCDQRSVEILYGDRTMTRDTAIGIVIHSLVTGFLVLAAMKGVTSANGELWVLATYLGASVGATLYPDLTTRVWVMTGSVMASFLWEFVLHHAVGK